MIYKDAQAAIDAADRHEDRLARQEHERRKMAERMRQDEAACRRYMDSY